MSDQLFNLMCLIALRVRGFFFLLLLLLLYFVFILFCFVLLFGFFGVYVTENIKNEYAINKKYSIH